MTKKLYLFLALCVLLCTQYKATAQAYSENFDDITTLAGSGWAIQNNSSPVGALGYFQGTSTTATPTPGPFNSYNGAANAYIAANFNSTGSTGTISNWLITPNRTLRNGDVFTFYTRKPTIGTGQVDYPDRLEVRMSTNGASTNVGTGATGLGDFTTLLLSVNPTLVANVYPQVWTQYTITISGLPAPTSGRIAFRYFVTSAGSLGSNSDYIGIDAVNYTPYVCPAFTMTAGGALTGGTAGVAYSRALTQTGALGAPNFAVTAGALPPGLTLSASGTISGTPTATGTFNFTVTVNDASGCSGSQSYSITVVCGSNPISFPTLAPLCSNSSTVTLSTATPGGGTYSGTGVTSGQFDPTAGTQTITYDYNDPYGCSYNTSQTQTVNTAPTVTLASLTDICSNAATVTLAGGAPAGGTFSGTGVSGGQFDPTAGTQTITYTYTDGNGCTNTASQTQTVNAAPTVTLAALTAVCSNAGTVALSGESPAGGTFSGTGVTGTSFDPSVGSQSITYSYTDANGCTSTDVETLTVYTAPTVTLAAPAAVCDNGGTVALAGESPAGGTFSGTGVTGTSFDPTAGTQTITYSYTDANGCTNTASQTQTVNTAPTVSLAALTAVCSNAGTVALSGESPAGGSFSGTGVTGTSFDPTAGTQTVTYTYTDGNGCTNTASQTQTVNAAPTVTLAALADVCSNAGTVALSGESPAGGTFSGTGVTGTSFDAAAGTQTITYSYTDANGCTNTASQTQTVYTAPTVTLAAPAAVCDNGGTVTLAGESPAGGTFSGTGVTGTSFDPTVGTQTITYTYTDGDGCTNSASQTLTVNAAPTVTLAALAAACDNAGTVTLSGESPAGGTFSGTGVTGTSFDPTAGTQTVTYTYTDGNGCTNSATQTQTVNAAPVVTLGAFTAVCSNAGAIVLSGESPVGGTFSGTGVTAGSFDPTAGSQSITYSYTDANGCTSTAVETLTVNTAPTVTLAALAAVCDNGATVTLSGESPAGGTFSGTGVTGTSFDPTAGTQTVTYTYTDGSGCTNSATQTQTVNTAPTVTYTAAAVCDNEGTVTLSGESPAGGTFSGTGVTGTSFDPASGTQAITYSYTDGNGCSNSATSTLTVNAAPTVTLAALADVCDNAGTITLSGGAPAGGTYTGTGVTAGSFDPTAGTQTVTYTYTDGNGCSNDASQVQTVTVCIGIETVEAAVVNCYPNPTTGAFTVNVSNVAGAKVSVRIVDLVGKLVAEDTNEGTTGAYNKVFNLSELAQGTYLVEVRNGATVYQQKVVKQ